MRNTRPLSRVFLLLSIIFVQFACSHQDPQISTRPNILVINVDDMGWKDPAFMGNLYYETPHIDRLASMGMVFSNAYAAAANCAPSRACLMSGLYAPRHGIYTVGNSDRGRSEHRRIIPVENNITLPDSILTIAEVLQDEGYKTIHVGKWHLGEDPMTQGFDVNIAGAHYGSPPGGYFSPYENVALSDGPENQYLTDRITTEAITAIKSAREEGKQFFMNFATYSVHAPIQPKPDKVPHYQAKPASAGHNNPRYAAMIESLDENIGRLVSYLDQTKQLTNTFILFTTDNGGVFQITSQRPLRAGKGSYYEGGIRVPTFVVWQGMIKPASNSDYPVINIDFYPTLLDVAGIDVPTGKLLDGISLKPILFDEMVLPERALFWHFPVYLQGGNEETSDLLFRTRPGCVVRNGAWKLHEYFEDGHLELYNLETDVGEKKDLTQLYPEKTRELHDLLTIWRENVRAPVPSIRNPEYVSVESK